MMAVLRVAVFAEELVSLEPDGSDRGYFVRFTRRGCSEQLRGWMPREDIAELLFPPAVAA